MDHLRGELNDITSGTIVMSDSGEVPDLVMYTDIEVPYFYYKMAKSHIKKGA